MFIIDVNLNKHEYETELSVNKRSSDEISSSYQDIQHKSLGFPELWDPLTLFQQAGSTYRDTGCKIHN